MRAGTRRLKTRAAALFLILVAVVGGMVAATSISFDASREAQQDQTRLLTWRYLSVAIESRTNVAVANLMQLNSAVRTDDPVDQSTLQARVTGDVALIQDLSRQVGQVAVDGPEIAVRDSEVLAANDFIVFARGYQKTVVQSNTDTLVAAAFETWQQATAPVALFIADGARQDAADALASSNFSAEFILGGGALALVSVFLLGIVVFRSLLRPVVDLAGAASALGGGADVEIPRSRRRDEIGDLGRALEAWRRTVKHRLAIAEASAALNETLDTNELLQTSASTLNDLTSSRHVTVTIVRDGDLVVAASAPVSPDVEWAGSSTTPNGPAMVAVRTKRAVIGDLIDSQWYETWLQVPVLADCGPLMALPLVSGGQAVGAVVWFRAAGEPAFTSADVENCQVVITQLAGAIRVSNTFDELVRTKAALVTATAHKGASEVKAGAEHHDKQAAARLSEDHGLIVLPAEAV